MPFVIDGHNLLKAIQKIDEKYHDLDEENLCRMLSKYFSLIGDTAQIVFDGTGPRDKTEFQRINRLEVFFSGPTREADPIIEQKIQANTAPKRLIVVSTDRRLRAAAAKRRAVSLRSENFWQIMTDRLDRPNTPSPEPKGKRHGITDSETDQWLQQFDL